jgi:hypothetical protein
MTKEIKKQQIKEAQNQYQAIVETKTNVQNRINYYQGLVAPFKFQLTLSAQPLAGLGWRLKAES